MRTTGLVLVLASVLLSTTAAAQTQITTAVIEGVVTDQSGAALPGVAVDVRNTDTGFSRLLVSDHEGRFVALLVPPGRYTVTLKLAGFSTLVQENVQATVGQAVRLAPVMQVSRLNETVTVSAQTSIVDAGRTASATTLNETAIRSTPILGRKFEDLLTLTPGVSIVQGPDGDEITFAGQRGVFNNISLDGGDYNNGFFGEQMGGQRAAIDITLDAVKEFQVVATGASAEYGHTAGAIVNVITKSGTNDVHGSLFHYQRLEGLTSDTSDGKPLQDFHREQFGGTVGGPITRDRTFYFLAFEGIRENLLRPNLSEAIGTPCPVSAPTLAANEALINSFGDCQRLALINFFQTTRGQDEGQPVQHTVNNNAMLGKVDWSVSPRHNFSASYNFDYSSNRNQTFDVPTYGTSANGTEGPSKINLINLNLFSALTATTVNEFHVTLSREDRPRSATESNIPADTGIGADPAFPSFRFGNPFFLAPNVDETMKRFQVKDNYSLIRGRHTLKTGAEWIHSNNTQVFRGFFEGRYLFSSVSGFLRYASPAAPGGFGPFTVACSNGIYVTAPTPCPGSTAPVGGPLLFYLQSSSPDGIARDAAGASDISNEEFAFFIQDRWQAGNGLTLDYGLRWEAQTMPETVDPSTTAFASLIGDPGFPSDGTIPSQWNQWQPRGGLVWDVGEKGKTAIRASAGLFYARQNMLSQVGSVTTNGIQQKSDFRDTSFTAFADMPVWPNLLAPSAVPPGTFPLFSGIRVFDRDYQNPRVFSFSTGFDRRDPAVHRGLLRFHLREGHEPDAVPQLQRARQRGGRHAAADARRHRLHRRQSVQPGARRRLRHQQPRALVLSRRHHRRPQAALAGLPARGELRDREGRRRRLERARSVHRSLVQLLRSEPGLRAVGPRHPAQVQLLREHEPAEAVLRHRPHPGAFGAADHDVAARAEQRRPRPQLGPQGQRLLLARLARAAALHRRQHGDHPELRDVQHLQQRQQRQPADDARAVQLRRVPAPGRRGSAPGTARDQGGVLTRRY